MVSMKEMQDHSFWPWREGDSLKIHFRYSRGGRPADRPLCDADPVLFGLQPVKREELTGRGYFMCTHCWDAYREITKTPRIGGLYRGF